MLDYSKTVKAYKSLSQVEQAFHCYKTIDLKVRPIYHRLAHRVRAHGVFVLASLLCGMANAPEISAVAI